MSRTLRKNNRNKKITENDRKKEYRCDCDWCRSLTKEKIKDKWAKEQL